MEYDWRVNGNKNENAAEELSKSINVNSTFAKILVDRKIDTYEKAESFFRPGLDELHDPFDMKDMWLAIRRLEKALDYEENILVYGDYDVDGTTSVALVTSFLSHFSNSKVEFYIPDRYSEGYGISLKGIDYAAENDFELIIALDCGIRAVDQVKYALEKGIDFIICDHHTPDLIIPDACAILNPKQLDCEYPYKELSGCGVGFKLMQAYCQNNDIDEDALYHYLDYLAISIAADIVPITGENRVFVQQGLKRMNEGIRPGLKALKQISGYENDLTVRDLVFGFAPRINAAGRLNHAREAVEILMEEDQAKADELSIEINNTNLARRDFDKQIQEEALAMIDESVELQNKKTTVLFKEDWHKGVVGIAASRCIEKYYKPTIILTESNGLITGSARSVHGFDIYVPLRKCRALLEKFGGHMYAAGLSLKKENLNEFIDKFERVVSNHIEDDDLIPKIFIDAELELETITWKFYNILTQMAPFGPGNMKPVFVTRGVINSGNSKNVGEDKSHLKVSIKKGDSQEISGIAFGMGHKLEIVTSGKPFDICYTIEENEFNGKTSLQMMVKDIKAV